MYGLEKKSPLYEPYDLEKEWKNATKAQHWRKKIDEKIEHIKSLIRQGSTPEEFHQLEQILQAYLSLKKIMNRITVR